MGLGGIFEGIGNLIESVSKISGEGISETGEIKGLGDKVKGVYGFTISTLAGGKSKVEPFGNIKKTPRGPAVKEESEPIIDVFVEKDHILIVAELPGVEAGDIKIEIKGDTLDLSAEKGDRKYKKEILMPCAVDVESMEKSYKNAILEIKFKKTEK